MSSQGKRETRAPPGSASAVGRDSVTQSCRDAARAMTPYLFLQRDRSCRTASSRHSRTAAKPCTQAAGNHQHHFTKKKKKKKSFLFALSKLQHLAKKLKSTSPAAALPSGRLAGTSSSSAKHERGLGFTAWCHRCPWRTEQATSIRLDHNPIIACWLWQTAAWRAEHPAITKSQLQ